MIPLAEVRRLDCSWMSSYPIRDGIANCTLVSLQDLHRYIIMAGKEIALQGEDG
jgi:hypothetical protein